MVLESLNLQFLTKVKHCHSEALILVLSTCIFGCHRRPYSDLLQSSAIRQGAEVL